MTKDGNKGSLNLAPDGTVVEPPKWKGHQATEAKERKSGKDEDSKDADDKNDENDKSKESGKEGDKECKGGNHEGGDNADDEGHEKGKSKESGKDGEKECKGGNHEGGDNADDKGHEKGKSKESEQEAKQELLNLSELVTVAQALQKQFPKATLGDVKAEREDKTVLYEVKLADGPTKMEATVAGDGTIVMIETVVADKDLPQAVADAIAKAAPGATVVKVEREETLAAPKLVTLEAPKVIYEAKVEGKGEVKVAADGTVLKAPKGDFERAKTEKPKVELPAAVATAFKDAFPKGEIEKVGVDQENGVTVYDIEFKNGAAEQEMDIAADGTILEVTLVVDAKAVPADAMKAIEKAAEGAEDHADREHRDPLPDPGQQGGQAH